ncbi:hypothetical protein J7T55_010369 [Diaporthe amygdali]|uniref:uncharacterized protein n=1 Tax=Phomopsis amygdali TaxID=1214568 RepID=UPI0022FEC1B8|nr:uncharacterized protein J7T55_010369 [Diaporthe amygdali]KAJ0115547.1 hypothetical protein J7T55_010369 [Diaporthe amygdali]
MLPAFWTIFVSLVAASPALLPSRQTSPDYGTVNFFWDTGCTQPAGTEYPENNVVMPGPAGVASMEWVQVTCVSALCTSNPTLFACADDNCNQAGIVRVGQCATYRTGVWAFWQRESATAGVGTGTGTQPAPAPANPFPFPFTPPVDTDGQGDDSQENN